MEKKEISAIVEHAKNAVGTFKLAEILGINPTQISSVVRGREALPFVAALKLAELLNADPLTITCANAALKEKNQERLNYLESKILPLEISRIIYAMSPKGIPVHNKKEFLNVSSENIFSTKKHVRQGAKYRFDLPPSDPRNWPAYRRPTLETSSAWALRPIPSFPRSCEPEEEPQFHEGLKNSTQKKEKVKA